MTRSRFAGWLLAIAMVAGWPAVSQAQEAVLMGTVTDTTGGVLPGATVTAVHEATGNTFEAVTEGAGTFRIPVRVGSYRVTAQLQGFQTVTRTNVQLLLGQQLNLGLELAPATLSETVTVTGEAPLIDVTTSSLGSNISQAQMEELPINGRNWQDLAMLAVGNKVNEVGTNEIAAEGVGTYQVNVDGQQITYEGGGLGNVQARFSRDAIAEFEYIANRFDASQGRSQGVQINAVTKSGTNQYLGTFGAYFRHDSLNAADHIVNRVLPYSNQQYSATHGGPLLRDRFHYSPTTRRSARTGPRSSGHRIRSSTSNSPSHARNTRPDCGSTISSRRASAPRCAARSGRTISSSTRDSRGARSTIPRSWCIRTATAIRCS
jgi:hypothetical protein